MNRINALSGSSTTPLVWRLGGGLTLTALAATSLFLSGCAPKDTFAKVNGQIISKGEYVKALERQQVTVPGGQPTNAERVVLDQMIGKKVILAEAAKANVLPSDDEVNKMYVTQKQLFENNTPGKKYEDAMQEQGTSPEDVKADIKSQLAETALYAKQLKLSEDEVRKAYENAHGQIGLPARAQLRLILVAPNSPDFQKVKQMLDSKTPFEQVAKDVNGTPALKATGGLLPQATPMNQVGALVGPQYQAAIQQANDGQVIGPIDFAINTTQKAKAWVKIEKRYPAYTISYEDAAPLVRQQLVQIKMMSPQYADVRNTIMSEKLKATFEPTDASYATVWNAVKKAAQDAGMGKASAAPAGGAGAPPLGGATATSPLGGGQAPAGKK